MSDRTEAATTAAASAPAKRPFLGHAMKALFEASDVSIQRGDETKVLSRAHQALAEIQRKSERPAPTPSTPPPPLASPVLESPTWNRPPAPRVDAVLWIVLALGLFAIVAWMLAYGL